MDDPNSSVTLPNHTCQRLTLAQIESATRNFDESLVIGKGGFGKVYKSLTNFGLVNEVAIKRLNSTSTQGSREFEAEVKVLSSLRHANLVPLIGYCSEGHEMALAYAFMPNGALEDHLHKGVSELSWLQRLKICVGAARGLDYLHTGPSTQHGVIHRDVKPANILLDSNFAAKVSDFGLARVSMINQTRTHVSTLVRGTFGYMDPGYFYSGRVTRKSDVYAFGVVLFEVLSGKNAVDQTLEENYNSSLAVWGQERVKEGRLGDIVSHTLIGQVSKKGLKEFSSLAANCLHVQPKQRPTMAEIVVKLESILLHEKQTVASEVVNDGRFISKVRYFFTGKTELVPVHEEGSKSDLIQPAGAAEVSESEIDGHRIPISHIPQIIRPPAPLRLDGLDKFLYGGKTSLPWVARLKIATSAAYDLSVLHTSRYPGYSQFKTSCILVDEDQDYNVILEDVEENSSDPYSFGTDAAYASPEWFRYQADVVLEMENNIKRPQFEYDHRVKSEIYSYGVVLLEILTGMKVFDRKRPQEKENLVKWATPLLPDVTNLGMILDPKLLNYNNNPPDGAFIVAKLVSACLQSNQDERPSIKQIEESLRHCYKKNEETCLENQHMFVPFAFDIFWRTCPLRCAFSETRSASL